ncbi:MAG: NUDIX hydrolase [Rhodocyclaceae bacterium]|nr:NUDIX hydrolase [Rhodocyclaceae bacterium]
MDRIWKPNVTVAAVVERDGRFLVVEEQTSEGLRLNQPAGHLEPDESLVDAARRETLEETAWEFTPEVLVGIYQWPRPSGDLTYLRFAFAGALGRHFAQRGLDNGIERALWLSRDELEACRERHRSPLVMQCVHDYVDGRRYDLALLTHYD